jgi:hypothetical protein
MDCRSCGVVNAPGRRYCRECGARLGQPCPVCHFFNAVEDKHCGGCGRRLKAGAGPLAADGVPPPAYAPTIADDMDLGALDNRVSPVTSATQADAGIGGQGVSQSEIDGLFENILDEEPDESAEGGA